MESIRLLFPFAGCAVMALVCMLLMHRSRDISASPPAPSEVEQLRAEVQQLRAELSKRPGGVDVTGDDQR